MITRLLVGFFLMAVCVVIHAIGVTAALRWLRYRITPALTLLGATRLLVGVATWVVLLHLAEIAAWAELFVWNRALADLPTALYFSAVTYTTTGYGDIVLPPPWRLDVGMEALTGILLCGWSTGFFFAVVSRFHDANSRSEAPGVTRRT